MAIFVGDPEEALASERESKRLSIWNGAAPRGEYHTKPVPRP